MTTGFVPVARGHTHILNFRRIVADAPRGRTLPHAREARGRRACLRGLARRPITEDGARRRRRAVRLVPAFASFGERGTPRTSVVPTGSLSDKAGTVARPHRSALRARASFARPDVAAAARGSEGVGCAGPAPGASVRRLADRGGVRGFRRASRNSARDAIVRAPRSSPPPRTRRSTATTTARGTTSRRSTSPSVSSPYSTSPPRAHPPPAWRLPTPP